MARDLMGECNNQRQPEGDFSLIWCARCVRPDCARSLHSKLTFTERTATWENRLFTDVKRLPMVDPRHQAIAGQRFVPVEVGPMPDIRTSWVDPNEVPTAVDRSPTPEKKPADPVDRRAPLAPTAPPPVGFQAGKGQAGLLRANAPSQGGRVLQGAPAAAPAPDPWATPAAPVDPVVKSGARIRLGGVVRGVGENKP